LLGHSVEDSLRPGGLSGVVNCALAGRVPCGGSPRGCVAYPLTRMARWDCDPIVGRGLAPVIVAMVGVWARSAQKVSGKLYMWMHVSREGAPELERSALVVYTSPSGGSAYSVSPSTGLEDCLQSVLVGPHEIAEIVNVDGTLAVDVLAVVQLGDFVIPIVTGDQV